MDLVVFLSVVDRSCLATAFVVARQGLLKFRGRKMVSSQIHCSQMKGLKTVYQSWVSSPCSISHSLNLRKTIPQRDFDQADTSTGPVPAFGIPKLALAKCRHHL